MRSRCCARIRHGASRTRSHRDGERSIARAYMKAFANARRLIYLEDQYLWSLDATSALCDALAAEPRIALCDRHPALPRSRRALPRRGEPLWQMARRTRARASRRRPGRDLRPRERRERADLRAREGLRRRRHVDGRRVRQPQSSLVDPRLGDLLRRRRPRRAPGPRDAPAPRPRASRRPATRPTMRSWIRSDGSTRLQRLGPRARSPGTTTASRALARAGISGATPATGSHAPRAPFLHFLHACSLDPDGRPRALRRAGRY